MNSSDFSYPFVNAAEQYPQTLEHADLSQLPGSMLTTSGEELKPPIDLEELQEQVFSPDLPLVYQFLHAIGTSGSTRKTCVGCRKAHQACNGERPCHRCKRMKTPCMEPRHEGAVSLWVHARRFGIPRHVKLSFLTNKNTLSSSKAKYDFATLRTLFIHSFIVTPPQFICMRFFCKSPG